MFTLHWLTCVCIEAHACKQFEYEGCILLTIPHMQEASKEMFTRRDTLLEEVGELDKET